MAEPASRMHSIFKVKADGRARLIVFDTQDLSLGRSPGNDLVYDDPEMSRKHAVFVRSDEGAQIKDLGTPNGTGLNGECVDHATLKHGDVVRVGDVEITYAETTRHPGTLGAVVEYASQLKAFAMSLPEGDGEVTTLGLGPLGGGETGSHRALDGDLDLLGAEPATDGDDPALAELSLDEPAAEADAPTAQAAAPVWELEDSDPELADLDVASPPGTGSLVLRVELDGLDGELRRALDALAGKLLELPQVRIRVERG